MHKISCLGALLLIQTMVFSQTGSQVPQKIDRPKIEERAPQQQQIAPLSPETLWKLARVNGEGIWKHGQQVIIGVSQYDLESNQSEKELFAVPIAGGDMVQITDRPGAESVLKIEGDDVYYIRNGQIWRLNLTSRADEQITNYEGGLANVKLSPDGQQILFTKQVLVQYYHSKDKYEELTESDVYIYDNLDYRHWDTWNDGKFNHPFVAKFEDGEITEERDLLEGESFYSPQMPFGGAGDYTWSPDGKSVYYVSKKKFGTAYALSTNTDLFRHDLQNDQVVNVTEGMEGYDTDPAFSKDGRWLGWLSMEKDGYEADKNDIYIQDPISGERHNLTGHWDGTVNAYTWSEDSKKIFFTAPTQGTVQLFEIQIPTDFKRKAQPVVKQLSDGQFDITGIIGETEEGLIVSSTTMTRAPEIYAFLWETKALRSISAVNEEIYEYVAHVDVKPRVTTASDGADLFSWVIYPPDFDPNKKYPTLLYCQGGPQSATTQSYSFRWNFQLLASQGYIVIAPNRRGMPGWGTAWNEEISGDWGGQAIRDYLSAIDDLAKEPYVDTERLGAVGASYGGYSVFQLAGIHEGRFKSFISHCGLFDMVSWYGTTEELFFANHDLGGPYWEQSNMKTYTEFNPIRRVDQWDTPILIIQGGKDYRVPIGQGLAAFQAAQLQGIKSRLVYLPDENHWVLSGHNAQVWHREFFKWLNETL